MWSWQRQEKRDVSRVGREPIDEENSRLAKKYFEEKRVEFQLACDAGDSGGCFSLGEWYLYFGKDEGKAHDLFRKSCFELKNGNACYSLGQLYQAGKLGQDKDERSKKTFELNKLACDYKNHAGCALAGTCKVQGFGCSKDVAAGKSMLKQACEDNDAVGCFQLGRLYLDGKDKHEVKRDPAESYKYMYKGCQLGHPNCCQVLSVMYLKGEGVDRSEKLHAFYRERTMNIIRQSGEKMGASVVE